MSERKYFQTEFKDGEIVIVDAGFPNGNYEAKIVSQGHIYATIEYNGTTRDVVKGRLSKKE